CILLVKQGSTHIPKTKAIAFSRPLWDMNSDSMFTRFDMTKFNVNGVGNCSWAPIRAAEIRRRKPTFEITGNRVIQSVATAVRPPRRKLKSSFAIEIDAVRFRDTLTSIAAAAVTCSHIAQFHIIHIFGRSKGKF